MKIIVLDLFKCGFAEKCLTTLDGGSGGRKKSAWMFLKTCVYEYVNKITNAPLIKTVAITEHRLE